MRRDFIAAIALAGIMLAGNCAWAADATGLWLTEDGKARVRIARCGAALCGTIAWLREPTDPQTGRAKTDKRNADPAKRNRPMLGVAIVLGMRPSGAEKWAGKVYNAEDGKTYSGYLTLTGATSLKLQGCILGGMICKSQTWSRVR